MKYIKPPTEAMPMHYRLNVPLIGYARAGLKGKVDIIDMAIIDYISIWINNKKGDFIEDVKGSKYVYINYNYMSNSIWAVPLKSKTTVYTRMAKIQKLNLINLRKVDGKIYAKLTGLTKEILAYIEPKKIVKKEVKKVVCEEQGVTNGDTPQKTGVTADVTGCIKWCYAPYQMVDKPVTPFGTNIRTYKYQYQISVTDISIASKKPDAEKFSFSTFSNTASEFLKYPFFTSSKKLAIIYKNYLHQISLLTNTFKEDIIMGKDTLSELLGKHGITDDIKQKVSEVHIDKYMSKLKNNPTDKVFKDSIKKLFISTSSMGGYSQLPNSGLGLKPYATVSSCLSYYKDHGLGSLLGIIFYGIENWPKIKSSINIKTTNPIYKAGDTPDLSIMIYNYPIILEMKENHTQVSERKVTQLTSKKAK